MRSLPIARRLQLVKLLRAHGVKDVERLREDELKDALARLSILLPDLGADVPFSPAVSATSSSLPATGADADADAEAVTETLAPLPSSSSFIAVGAVGDGALDPLAGLEHIDDPHALPRFREPKPSLPEGARTFLRAITVKPGELFVTWQLHGDVVTAPGPTRLFVHATDVVGAAPTAQQVLAQPPRLVVDVDRAAPGWYAHVADARWAIVVQLMAGDDVIATSNVALTPPASPAPSGAFVLARIEPDVDRRALRGAQLITPTAPLPTGVDVVVNGTVDAHGIVTDAHGTIVGGGALSALLAQQSTSSPWSRTSPPSSSSRPSSSSVSRNRT